MDSSNQSNALIVTKPDKIMQFFPFFYGYVALVIGSIGKIMSSPGQSICIGVVIANMIKDLNMSSTYCSVLYFIGTTCSALVLPQCGKLQQKFGQRISVTIISLGLGLACIFFSLAQGTISVLLSFFMLRFFGQGNIMSVSVVMVNLWWVKYRGKMLGVANAVMSTFMIGIIPIFMNNLMINYDWRITYKTLGCIVLFIMLPIGFLFFRNSPESYGLLPDDMKNNQNETNSLKQSLIVEEKQELELQRVSIQGDIIINTENNIELESQNEKINQNQDLEKKQEQEQQKQQVQEINFTVQEMKATSSFWVIVLSQTILALTGTAFIFHMRALFEIKQVSTETINLVYIFLSFTSIVFPLVTGLLIDKYQTHYLIVISLWANGLGQILMIFLEQDRMYIVFTSTLMIGIGMGMMQTLSSTVMSIYYGRKYISQIQTILQSFMVFGSAIGPLPFSAAFDYLGSYEVAFLIGASLPFIGSYFVLTKGQKPEKPQKTQMKQ